MKVGSLVRWPSSGGSAYGKINKIVRNGSVSALPEGPTMQGTAENPAIQIQVWTFANGKWKETETMTVHRSDGLNLIDSLPMTKADPLGGIIPQELVTGDILKGHGPRRGNLERLLRYWRPIMRKEGGFTRCKVILADHPELYPLNNICAWLHHETTGLWPNEGCHHPGMKNCRNKLKKRNWTDNQFSRALRTSTPSSGKSLFKDDVFFGDAIQVKNYMQIGEPQQVVTVSDLQHALSVLSDFMLMEPHFIEWLHDPDNWDHEGEDSNGNALTMPYEPSNCEHCE